MELGGDGNGDESEGKDHLSALPDDALIVILLKLDTREAVRTSVLSRRWCRIWALLPGLAFDSNTSPHQIVTTLQSHEAALQCLLVFSQDATAESVATWISVAAPRLSGRLIFQNLEQERIAEEGDEEIAQESDDEIVEESDEEISQESDGEITEESDEEITEESDEEISQEGNDDDEASQRGAFELPCLERATSVALHLGFLGISMPPAGVFTRLHELLLSCFHFHGPRLLGDAVSWMQCRCLQRLTILDARGLDNLDIHSNSLKQMCLSNVCSLQQLNVVAPALEFFKIKFCFYNSWSQPVASIMAPKLGTLMWSDLYDPSSVDLVKMENLRLLQPLTFIVYGNDNLTFNPSCLSLLRHFKVIEHLILRLFYPQNLDNRQYMMEDMTMLPDITILDLNVIANGHCFGASAFHVLRMCSGIRRMMLTLADAEEQCATGCICIQQQSWETEHLLLNHLKEVEIHQFTGSEHEISFVKQLLVWATSLEKMTVTFDDSITETVAKELGQVLRSFYRAEHTWNLYVSRQEGMTKAPGLP